MKTINFIKLAQTFTNIDFQIKTTDSELQPEKSYYIYKITPIRQITVGFDFKIPKNEESIIKSFISTFCNKYKQPNPAAYNGVYGSDWSKMNDSDKEFAYYHHRSNMYSKTQLLEQIKENLNDSKVEDVLCKYGFYSTLYGLGIFVLFSGIYEINAINRMKAYLLENGIPYKNELSDANWVYRFVINANKDIHSDLLSKFR